MNWTNAWWILAPPVLILMIVWPGAAVMSARLSRPELFFTITVDAGLRDSAAGRLIQRRFAKSTIAASAAGLALALTGLLAPMPPAFRSALLLLGFAAQAAGIIKAYSVARSAARAYHVEPTGEREAVLSPRRVKLPGGLAGQTGPFLILAASALWVWLRWDAIPARFPIHFDLAGRPNGWAAKSAGTVFLSPLMGAATCLFLGVLFGGFARGVRRIHGSGPEAAREVRNLGSMLKLILGMEYCLALMFSAFGVIPLVGAPGSPGLAGAVAVGVTLVTTVGMIVVVVVLAFRGGQGGWRLRGGAACGGAGGAGAPVGDRTPDERWWGGLVYINRDDPALWVEKRFGIGWTLNFGNPWAWLVMGGILGFCAGISGLAIILTRG